MNQPGSASYHFALATALVGGLVATGAAFTLLAVDRPRGFAIAAGIALSLLVVAIAGMVRIARGVVRAMPDPTPEPEPAVAYGGPVVPHWQFADPGDWCPAHDGGDGPCWCPDVPTEEAERQQMACPMTHLGAARDA